MALRTEAWQSGVTLIGKPCANLQWYVTYKLSYRDVCDLMSTEKTEITEKTE